MKKFMTSCMAVALVILGHSCTSSTENTACCQYVAGNEIAALAAPQATTVNGVLEGVNESGVAVFKGVPFAAPPVGELRWKAPQPVENWTGVKDAKEFGPNPMQRPIFGDMAFGTKEMSEDCLYLNIWTPATSTADKLPVFIYFNGGGMRAGSGSEPRYAGMTFARNGIVAITANYREDIFGYFAHPELSAETEYKGSGNYGNIDQAAAIAWVKENIAAFGGDPEKITIMGESAGSRSVCILMASPLSKGLIAQAMGSSGSSVGAPVLTLEEAEQAGLAIQEKVGCASLAELRAMPAEELMNKAELAAATNNIDNYLIVEQPYLTYKKGEQAQVPVLIGNNNAELFPQLVCGSDATLNGMKAGFKKWLGEEATDADIDRICELYGLVDDASVMQLPGYAAGGDKFIAFNTVKWINMIAATTTQPVYRYRFCKARPDLIDNNKVSALAGGTRDKEKGEETTPSTPGAIHSVDIEYQMGNIPTTPIYEWTAVDFDISEVFVKLFVNFVKTGNPNGLGVPQWDPINGEDVPPVMCIGVKSYQERDPLMKERYELLDKYLDLGL